MAKAKKGDKVTINFTGKLEDGSIIDTTFPDAEGHKCSGDECEHEHGPMELVLTIAGAAATRGIYRFIYRIYYLGNKNGVVLAA